MWVDRESPLRETATRVSRAGRVQGRENQKVDPLSTTDSHPMSPRNRVANCLVLAILLESAVLSQVNTYTLCYGQSESCAVVTSGYITGHNLPEGQKESFLVLFRNSDTSILYKSIGLSN